MEKCLECYRKAKKGKIQLCFNCYHRILYHTKDLSKYYRKDYSTTCPVCNKFFEKKRYNQLTCSIECKRKKDDKIKLEKIRLEKIKLEGEQNASTMPSMQKND